jgi:hypothetical protein
MADNEVIYIAIAPPANPDENLVRSVAAIFDKTSYDTRPLISGEIPRIIARYDNMQMIEPIINKLHNLGLEAIAVRDSELRQSASGFNVRMLEFIDKEVIFQDNAGNEKRIGGNDIFLILKGRIQTSVKIETTQSKRKINVAGTLLSGGIPMWRKVDEKTTRQSVQDEYFIRLYNRMSADNYIEILQQNMNYSFMGEKMAASSLANFDNLTPMLREIFSKAIFDEKLVKQYTVNTYSNRIDDDIEVKCRLIYMFHIITHDIGSKK